MKKHRIVLLLLTCLWGMGISAQYVTLQGTVEDSKGEGIPGASIYVEDTRNGTITDINGQFQIQCNPESALRISCIGYKNRKISAKGQKNLKIVLTEDNYDLDEVVVVGYGVMRKSDLTGAVASVKAEEALKQMPVSNITDALQGRLSGVSIISASGQPGSEATIRVRGVNSINADQGPLVVIDGFIGGSLSSLNPADIQSVEVLKDASATAIYGSQGANGVILVTTKNAEKGKLSFQYNGYVNFKTPYTLPDRLSPGDFARLANDYGKEFYTASGADVKTFYTDEEIAAFDNGTAGYDYVDNIFRNVSVEHTHEVSVSGGENKTQYLISARYTSNQGIVESSSSDQMNYRVKVDSELKPWLKLGVNLWGEYQTSQGPRFSQYRGVLLESLIFPNTVQPKNENGQYNNLNLLGSAQYNPMGHIWELNRDDYSLKTRLQGYVELRLLPGLTLRMNQSFNFGTSVYRITNNENSYDAWAANSISSARAQTGNAYNWINSNILAYQKEFNRNHRLNATFVFEQNHSDSFTNTSSATGLPSTEIGANNTSLGLVVGGSSTRTKASLLSTMARVNYVFMNRYMLTASYRWDGSSRLAYENRWDGFPSLALAWDIKQEAFMQHVSPVSQLKLRLGYGQTGNQAVAAYSAFNEYTTSRNAQNELLLQLARIGNPNLKWERTEQYNVGLDLGFFDNRLVFNVDWYHKLSKDVLISINVPTYTGQQTALANAAHILNKGVEITVNATPIANQSVTWNSVLTLSHNQGTFEKFSDGTDMIAPSGGYEYDYYRYIKGKKIGSIWGYRCEGIWTTEEVRQLPEDNRPEPGSYKFKDLDNSSSITVDDQEIIGNGQPKFNWGWTNTVTYKNFDFSLFMIGYHGFDIYNYTRQARTIGLTPDPEMNNRWTPDNENGTIEGFIKTPTGGRVSSLFVEKGDFLKIKSITIGYTLPQKALKKIRLTQLRCYVSVQNPLLITGYSGIDPEVTLKNPLTSGIDWGYYPNGRNYMAGLSFSF